MDTRNRPHTSVTGPGSPRAHADSEPAGERPARARARSQWTELPLLSKLYVAAIVLLGAGVLVAYFPRSLPQPALFAVLIAFACLTSTWKVTLSALVANGSTLSVSYAAHLMSLLLLGPAPAVVVAVIGVLTQCKYKAKQPYPLHRTVFSMAAAAITMAATGEVYVWLAGSQFPLEPSQLPKPVIGAIATYFLVNTSLVAAAIALSTGRTFWNTWRQDFLWSGASFMFAGSAGALAAVVVNRGDHWKAVLLVAPIYLTYRTYELFVGRLEDQRRHTDEIQRLHQETLQALRQAREAEQALAGEKERLATALADMTRLEESRNQLLKRERIARAGAEEANRLKDQFLAIVSHELRTPLNAILGWAHALGQPNVAADVNMRDRGCRAIYENARRQAQLIEDLLDVARISSGKLRLERAVIDVNETLLSALQVVQPSAEAKGIRVTVDADPSAGAIYADGARLQQIVWNLLSNAVKFTPQNGAVHVRLRRDNGAVEIAVADTGQGIADDFLPSVFEPFRQADGSITRTHSGLGLGLSIVKSLVEAHGGTVTVKSGGDGLGSTFTVRIPVALPTAARRSLAVEGVPTATDLEQQPSLQGILVLAVDDDEYSRELVAAHLHGSGARVLSAASAAEAFEVLQREPVDVLLADIGMPGEDGYSFIRRLRAQKVPRIACVPAAALTAFAREDDRQQALQAGFQLHLAKPIEPFSLVAAVNTLRTLKFAES
jgi:signal transduction histidine kinase/ActR/RegA family two-component response regulator